MNTIINRHEILPNSINTLPMLHEGEVIADRYEVLPHVARSDRKLLGFTENSSVCPAVDIQSETEVAVKLLRKNTVPALGRHQIEQLVGNNVSHEGIIPTLATGIYSGQDGRINPFIVTKQGNDGYHNLEIDHSSEGAQEFFGRMAKIALALTYLHEEKGIAHGDVKSSNIILDNGHTFLNDFSTTEAIREINSTNPLINSELTEEITIINKENEDILVGTPSHLSPQRLEGNHLTAEDDTFALGVTIFEFLTKRHPYNSTSSDIYVQANLLKKSSPLPAEELPNFVSDEVSGALYASIEKLPQNRPSSREMARVLLSAAS